MHTLTIYTDGSYTAEYNRIGWEIVACLEAGQELSKGECFAISISQGIVKLSSLTAELKAIEAGLDMCTTGEIPCEEYLTCIIRTDCQSAIDQINHSSGRPEYARVIRRIHSHMNVMDQRGIKVYLEKVRGHSTDIHNNLADKLSRGEA
eukprot:snap_masked-scaffold_4-processed-gene-14.14-mRNA-1 protein AED:1.00 eAED:1.00 QI:0/-1/0/0/-1/1/1/0/148